MVSMTALALSFLALTVAANNVVSPQRGTQGDEEGSCTEAPRAGSALLQTSAASTVAPLAGRVLSLEAEMTSLEERVSALQDSIGVSGAGAGAESAPALIQKAKKEPYARYALLLRSIAKYDSASLKDDVASLEGRAATVKSEIMTLENQVSGNTFTAKYSLLSDDVRTAQAGASLSSRVEGLENETSEFRTRVTSLEQTVVGLQLKAE